MTISRAGSGGTVPKEDVVFIKLMNILFTLIIVAFWSLLCLQKYHICRLYFNGFYLIINTALKRASDFMTYPVFAQLEKDKAQFESYPYIVVQHNSIQYSQTHKSCVVIKNPETAEAIQLYMLRLSWLCPNNVILYE